MGVFSEADRAVEELEEAFEEAFGVDYPLAFEGVNGGGDEPSYEERCESLGIKPWWEREGVPLAGLFASFGGVA